MLVTTTLMVYLPGGVASDGYKVRVLAPAPGAAKRAGEKVPVMPAGKPFTEREVALLKVPMSATVTTTGVLAACTTESEALAKATEKLGGMASVKGMLIVWLKVPPLAVTAMVELPETALDPAVIVKLAVPVPGTSVDGENEVVTPVAWPLAVSAKVFGSAPSGELQVRRTLVACPSVNATVAGVANSVHLGTMAITVNETVAVLEMPPPVAVIVTG